MPVPDFRFACALARVRVRLRIRGIQCGCLLQFLDDGSDLVLLLKQNAKLIVSLSEPCVKLQRFTEERFSLFQPAELYSNPPKFNGGHAERMRCSRFSRVASRYRRIASFFPVPSRLKPRLSCLHKPSIQGNGFFKLGDGGGQVLAIMIQPTLPVRIERISRTGLGQLLHLGPSPGWAPPAIHKPWPA